MTCLEIISEAAPGHAGRTNEDEWLYLRHPQVAGLTFMAVIDGVGGSENEGSLGSPTPGSFAAAVVKQSLLAKLLSDPWVPLGEALLEANQTLRRELDAAMEGAVEGQMRQLADAREIRLVLPACVVTLVRVAHLKGCPVLEYAHAGDTCLIVGLTSGEIRVPTPDQMGGFDAEVLGRAIDLQCQRGTRRLCLREVLELPEVRRADRRNRMHHNYVDENGLTVAGSGCGVLNGLPELEAYLRVGMIPLDEVDFLMLVSDGLLWPASKSELTASVLPGDLANYATPIHGRTAQIGNRKGLRALLDELRVLEREDQCLDEYPRIKQHDDATGILLRLN